MKLRTVRIIRGIIAVLMVAFAIANMVSGNHLFAWVQLAIAAFLGWVAIKPPVSAKE